MQDKSPPPSPEKSDWPEAAPPLSPEWAAIKEWVADEKVAAEKSGWPDETSLQGTKDQNTIRFLQNYGWIAVVLMWFLTLTFMASMAVWFFHFLTPWGWLTGEQLSKIQTVVFSGSLGALVSAFAQKHIAQS